MTMDDALVRFITLQDANTRTVLLGTALLGLCAGVVGALAVIRRRALASDAVAHAALPGICVAYFIVGERDFAMFLLGALASGLAGIGVMVAIRRWTRIKEDAAMAVVLGSFFGLGVVLSQRAQATPGGNKAGLDGFIFGKAASMVGEDVRVIAAVTLVCLVVVGLLLKELRALCFDREFAASQGWPVLALDLTLMGLIAVVTVAGLPAAGVVLMAALLVIPAVAARFWTDRLSVMLGLAGALGALSGVIGTTLSATLPPPSGSLSRGFATGPMIVLAAAGMFVVSLVAAPRRGLVSRWARRAGLARRIGLQNLLRAVYERGEIAVEEGRGALAGPAAVEELVARRAWSLGEVEGLVGRAVRRGWALRTAEGRVMLTPAGLDHAARLVRTHRLWEQFLVEQADIAPDHVDRDADDIEHVLPLDVVKRLEGRLLERGTLPRFDAAGHVIVESPHALAARRAGRAR